MNGLNLAKGKKLLWSSNTNLEGDTEADLSIQTSDGTTSLIITLGNQTYTITANTSRSFYRVKHRRNKNKSRFLELVIFTLNGRQL